MFRCNLCASNAPPYVDESTLLDHVSQVHLMDKESYLTASQQRRITPETTTDGTEDDGTTPSDEEMALLRQYTSMGLNPQDPRLQRVCWLQATIKRREALIRMQTAAQIDLDSLKTLQAPVKQAEDILKVLFAEKKASEDKDQSGNEMLDTLKDAEVYCRGNAGDFQFYAACRKCKQGIWVNTDGLPVWMLIQEPDPENPTRQIVLVGNSEIFYLVNRGLLPLATAAFLTRTSPEGLAYTANYRGTPIIPRDDKNRLLALEKAEISLSGLRSRYEQDTDREASPLPS